MAKVLTLGNRHEWRHPIVERIAQIAVLRLQVTLLLLGEAEQP
jgi:hypothetical protein